MVEVANNKLLYQVTKQGKLVEGSPLGILEDTKFSGADITKAYTCLRPDQISKFGAGAKIVSDNSHHNDVIQGNLGDCYFITVLAMLAEKPERIKNLFESYEVNSEGIYHIKMLRDGIWVSLKVDDSLPCEGNEPIFAYSRANELWVSLVEKAAAQKFGSYDYLKSGLVTDPMQDLTGAPIRDQIPEDGDLWKFLMEAENSNGVMAAGTGTEKTNEHIVIQHAYSILKVAEIEKDGMSVKLLQVHNPHGGNEWKGDWSDRSPIWTEELKQKLGYADRVDGSFFISFEDFKKHYSDIQICWINDNYFYSACPVALGTRNWIAVSVTLQSDCQEAYPKVTQPDQRPNSVKNYLMTDLRLFSRNSNRELTLVASSNYNARDVRTTAQSLKKGEYVLYAHLPNLKIDQSYTICLSFYSDQRFDFLQNETDIYAAIKGFPDTILTSDAK